MEFKEFRNAISKHFNSMVKNIDYLFVVDVDKDEMWNTYLDSYPEGTNEIYRTRREYDCSCCRQFIKTIGNVVSIKGGVVDTIWNVPASDEFKVVANIMDEYIRSKEIRGVFVSKVAKIGTEYNMEQLENGELKRWEHFQVTLPSKLVDRSEESVGEIQGSFRDTAHVFKRSLEEISLDALDTVLELINSNTLYKGAEWKNILEAFRKYKKKYEKLASAKEKDLFVWEYSIEAGNVIGRIRNHSIGSLLVDISEDMDLDTAVSRYEKMTAPDNYKRPKAIFSKRMLEDAKKTIMDLGYMDSLSRRFATLDDITINNILFANRDAIKHTKQPDDIFGEMEKDVVSNPKKFSRVEEISAQDFINNVLPTAHSVEAFVENKHAKNFVSLIAPLVDGSPTMFKWNNGMSWAYTGNITDSDMKENVKAAGGNVDGVLRFSIQWNESGKDDSDLDAHCIEPNNNEIYFAHCRKPEMSRTTGQLDVDVIHPGKDVAVENIIWTDLKRMMPGTYKMNVHQFTCRGSKGFKAEVECNGEIHSFVYDRPLRNNETVKVAEVILDANGEFTVKDKLQGNSMVHSENIWNIRTNQFVPVSVVCYSPNYWDEQEGIGHKHLFFMLDGCVNPEEPNGYYNEFLKNSLQKHKRVFEALGSKCHVENTENQLSGIGFSMTKRADVVVKVKGATERIMKVKF